MIDVVSKSGAIYQYDDGDCIGDPGRYGSVFKGVTADGSPVAIKVVAYRTNSPTRLSEDRILAEYYSRGFPVCGRVAAQGDGCSPGVTTLRYLLSVVAGYPVSVAARSRVL